MSEIKLIAGFPEEIRLFWILVVASEQVNASVQINRIGRQTSPILPLSLLKNVCSVVTDSS